MKESLRSGVDSARSAAGSLSDGASRAKHALQDSLGNIGDSASGTGQRMRMESQRVRHGFETLLEEQPLLVGAFGLALGAALGAAFPRTEVEDRMLGEQRDSAMRSMKDKAAGAYEDVKETAADMVQSQTSRLSSSEEGTGTEQLTSRQEDSTSERAATGASGPSRDNEWHNTRGGI